MNLMSLKELEGMLACTWFFWFSKNDMLQNFLLLDLPSCPQTVRSDSLAGPLQGMWVGQPLQNHARKVQFFAPGPGAASAVQVWWWREDVQRYPKSTFDLYRNETLTLTMKWQWIYNIHLGYPCADGWCYDPFSRGGRSAYNHLWTIKPLILYSGLKPNDHPKSHSPP